MKRLLIIFMLTMSLAMTAQTVPSYPNAKFTQLVQGTKSDSVAVYKADKTLGWVKRSEFNSPTNLDALASPTEVKIFSSTGNPAIIPLATTTNSGLLSPTSLTSGTITATGNITSWHGVAANGDITSNGNISAVGTIYGSNISNINNTSDANKPVSTATTSALNLKENIANKSIANGYAGLGSDGKLITSQLPALAITDTYFATSDAEMIALGDAMTGDVCIRTDLNETYILQGDDYTILDEWKQLLSPVSGVNSVFGRVGSVTQETGDYTTDQIQETDSRVFQTPEQNANNDATSPIQEQFSNYLPLSGGNLTGTLAILNYNYSSPNIYIGNNGTGKGIYSINSSTGYNSYFVNNNIGIGSEFTNSSGGKAVEITNLSSSNGIGLNIINESTSSSQPIVINNNGTGNSLSINNTSSSQYFFIGRTDGGTLSAYIKSTGDIFGNSFIKSGGTSSQFLKANGTVDSNTYLTSLSGAVLTSGNQTITGVKTFSNGISGQLTGSVIGYASQVLTGTSSTNTDYPIVFSEAYSGIPATIHSGTAFTINPSTSLIKATGNIQASSFVGSGASLTGITEGQVTNLVTDLAGKQSTLVSGTNIKTVNGNSLLGSGDISISSSGWSLSGNSGTTYGTNFIGTTDNTSLLFKVNNIVSGSIEKSQYSGSSSFGLYSLSSLTGTGTQYNTSVGNNSMWHTTSGIQNVSVGNSALYQNTLGSYNVAVGSGSLSNYYNFNSQATTGGNNIAVGYLSGLNIVDGNYNICIGDVTHTRTSSGNKDYNLNIGGYLWGKIDPTNPQLIIGYRPSGSENSASGFSTCATLDLTSNNMGLLLPRLTKAQRNSIIGPEAGLMIYQTDNIPGLRTYNGTNWMAYTEAAD